MSEELEVLKMVTRKLDEAKIPYVISGSIAANYYTVPRMTRDLDVVVEMQESDVKNFVRLFQEDFFVDEDMVRTEVKKKGMFNLIQSAYIIKIDFILRKESDWQVMVFARRQKVQIDDMSIWLISPEDLILAKLLWAKDSASEMQLNDVRNLLQSAERLDGAYIKQWMAALGLQEVYQKVQ